MKRDRLLAFIIQLPRLGIILTFIVYFVVLWGLFFRWPSLPLLLRGSLGMVLSLLFLRQVVRPLTKTEVGKQWRRIERLRMNPQEAPLCEIQPDADLTRLVPPIILAVRLSYAVYFVFAIFWLASFAVAILLWNVLGEMENRGAVFFLWFALGGVIIGITGVLMYQRIEITEQALIVQRGLIRRKLLWKEARFFALIRFLDRHDGPRHYELGNEHVLLRWLASSPRFGFVCRPKDKAEYEQILNNLLAYIRARTSLPLLNLS